MQAHGRSKRVSHPILRLKVLSSQGVRVGDDTVFCQLRRQSVPVDLCATCRHCDAIQEGVAPSVDCTIPVSSAEERLGRDPDGLRTEVGTLLDSGAVVVDESVPSREVLRLMRDEDRRSIAVVDRRHSLVGIVHETSFVRLASPRSIVAPPPSDERVARVMSSATSVYETLPIRVALRVLASSHLREATVISAQGKPLGVFRDVDGLRWIGRAHKNCSDSGVRAISMYADDEDS